MGKRHVRQVISRILKDPDSYKVHGPDEISPYMLMKCAHKLEKPPDTLKKINGGRISTKRVQKNKAQIIS